MKQSYKSKKKAKNEIDENEEENDSKIVIEKNYLENEFESRKKIINQKNSLEFNFIISFTTSFKTFLELCKKISDTVNFFIISDKEEKIDGCIISCETKNISLKSNFYKESFLEFFTTEKYIHFKINISDIISKIKTSKRNNYFRIYKLKENNNIYVSNAPFLQFKLSKIKELENKSSFLLPLSGIITNKENFKKIPIKMYSNKSIDFLGSSDNENIYFECLKNDTEINNLNINSNQFCKIISYLNKNKFNSVIFEFSYVKVINSSKKEEIIEIKKIKSLIPKTNIEEEFILYDFYSFSKEENYELIKTNIFYFSLNSILNFIKIKNFNEETNNILKLKFYKDYLFIESLLSNSATVTISIKTEN